MEAQAKDLETKKVPEQTAKSRWGMLKKAARRASFAEDVGNLQAGRPIRSFRRSTSEKSPKMRGIVAMAAQAAAEHKASEEADVNSAKQDEQAALDHEKTTRRNSASEAAVDGMARIDRLRASPAWVSS